jgi:cobalt/nickel transport system permease protein
MILFLASTPFPKLLNGLQMLKVPTVFVMLLNFLYRYVFIFEDEAMKLGQARRARKFNHGDVGLWWEHLKSNSRIIGTLFIRAYERGERVYASMCARGFSGEVVLPESIRLEFGDIAKACVVICLMVGIKILF